MKEFEQDIDQQVKETAKIIALLQKLPAGKRSYLMGVIDTLSAVENLEEKETA